MDLNKLAFNVAERDLAHATKLAQATSGAALIKQGEMQERLRIIKALSDEFKMEQTISVSLSDLVDMINAGTECTCDPCDDRDCDCRTQRCDYCKEQD